MTILHVLFAGMGWVFRYEAYLMVLGLLVITIVISELITENYFSGFERKLFSKYIPIILLVCTIIPLAGRGCLSLLRTRHAIKNIYEQQYQMGIFLKSFYQGKGVAANDIGAINYLADIKCLDLWGLSSIDVAKAKRNRTYSTQKINLFTKQKDIEIAIIYSEWLNEYGGVPSSWIKVGEWTILDNVICGGKIVSFYAVKSTERESLIQNLKSFSSKLPQDVVQSINQSK